MKNIATLDLNSIEFKPEFRVRTEPFDPAVVARYRESLDSLPEIEVWREPETGSIYLISGRHRLEANRAEGYREVAVVYVEGDYDDAFVRARAANLGHGLPYAPQEWQQAVRDIVRRRYRRANAWIAREAGCSARTVGRIRAELEQAGDIPWLEFLETENGQPVQRHPRPEEETSEEQEAALGKADPSNLAKVATEAAAGLPLEGSGRAGRVGSDTGNSHSRENTGAGDSRPVNVTLKLAQLGEPLAAEAGLWIDGHLHPIPVTLLIAATPPDGLAETAPGYDNCLVITKSLAAALKLLLL
ncbi:MAG: hypothetical protein HC875_41420 [Anaerolineales bacterium]|nr:hypothetical protein [Anaerolineales bacterium]